MFMILKIIILVKYNMDQLKEVFYKQHKNLKIIFMELYIGLHQIFYKNLSNQHVFQKKRT